jgi:hypothetical protein
MRGSLCWQHKVNEFLDRDMKNQPQLPNLNGHKAPIHLNFM